MLRQHRPWCEACGSQNDLTVDHIVPRSLGGTDDIGNLRVLCRNCHNRIGVTSRTPGYLG